MNKNIQRLAGLIMILAGLSSFFLNPSRPPTAFIGPFIGVVLLFLSIGLGRNIRSYYFSLLLSLLFGVMTANMAFKSYDKEDSPEKSRRIVVFWSMSIACLGNGAFLLANYKKRSGNE
ncbi:hypothetical protein HZR84_05930 [Hyphobacterium sp. CCMP332]|nr:hypothetical protein HZR84_05930 [Hyphobacterium sp. CCMP332]